jgi:hypothetical protein
VRRGRNTRPHLRWASATVVPFVIGGDPTTVLTAAVGISLLMLVLVIVVVALGASFTRRTARRRACLQALQVLLRLAQWADKR